VFRSDLNTYGKIHWGAAKNAKCPCLYSLGVKSGYNSAGKNIIFYFVTFSIYED